MKKFFKSPLLLILAIVASIFLHSLNAFAVSLSPSKHTLDVEPGKTYEVSYTLDKDFDHTQTLTYQAEIAGLRYETDGTKTILEGEDKNDEPYYSVSGWPSQNKYEISGQEEPIITIPFAVPEDTQSGTYYFYVLLSGKKTVDSEEGGIFEVKGRIASPVVLTVQGESDIEENMTLESFTINEEKYENGEIEFLLTFKNESPVQLLPTGSIQIFDSNDEQVTGIVTETTKLGDGTSAVLKSQDELTINRKISIPPSTTLDIKVPWKDRTIGSGKYTAKVEGYFGKEGNFSSDLDFEIKEGMEVSNIEAPFFNFGLPVNFNTTLRNNGDTAKTVDITLRVNGIIGNTVFTQDEKNVSVLPKAETKVGNLTWDHGFGFGYYNVTLELVDAEGAKHIKSTPIVVIDVIGIVILLVLITLIVLFVKKYLKLKAAAEKNGKEKEDK